MSLRDKTRLTLQVAADSLQQLYAGELSWRTAWQVEFPRRGSGRRRPHRDRGQGGEQRRPGHPREQLGGGHARQARSKLTADSVQRLAPVSVIIEDQADAAANLVEGRRRDRAELLVEAIDGDGSELMAKGDAGLWEATLGRLEGDRKAVPLEAGGDRHNPDQAVR